MAHNGDKLSKARTTSFIFALAVSIVLFVPSSCLLLMLWPGDVTIGDTFTVSLGGVDVPFVPLALAGTTAIFFLLWWAIYQVRTSDLDGAKAEEQEQALQARGASKEFCPQCGHQVDAADKFCRECRHKLQ